MKSYTIMDHVISGDREAAYNRMLEYSAEYDSSNVASQKLGCSDCATCMYRIALSDDLQGRPEENGKRYLPSVCTASKKH